YGSLIPFCYDVIILWNLGKYSSVFWTICPLSSNFHIPSVSYRDECIIEKAGVIIGWNRSRYNAGGWHVSRHGRRGIMFLIPLCAADFPGIFIVHNWNKCKRATRKSERENSQ